MSPEFERILKYLILQREIADMKVDMLELVDRLVEVIKGQCLQSLAGKIGATCFI